MIYIEEMLSIGAACEQADKALFAFGMPARFCKTLAHLERSMEGIKVNLDDPSDDTRFFHIENSIRNLGKEADAKTLTLA